MVQSRNCLSRLTRADWDNFFAGTATAPGNSRLDASFQYVNTVINPAQSGVLLQLYLLQYPAIASYCSAKYQITIGLLTFETLANKITFVMQNYIQLVLGIWILLSPWLLGFSSISIMTWSNLIAGIIIILINVWAIFGEAAELPEEKEIKQ